MVALPLATIANPLILPRHYLSSLPDPAPTSLSIRIDFECSTMYRQFFTICHRQIAATAIQTFAATTIANHDQHYQTNQTKFQPQPTSTDRAGWLNY